MRAVAALRIGMPRATVEALLGGSGDQRYKSYWYACDDAVDVYGEPIALAVGYYGSDDGVDASMFDRLSFFEVSGRRE